MLDSHPLPANNDTPSAVTHLPLSFRWWPAMIIVLVMASFQLLVWRVMPEDRTIQMMWSLGGWALMVLSLGLWWMFFSRLTWLVRGLGVLSVVIFLIGFNVLFRFEGFSGEVIPHYVPRWAPDRKAQAEAYFAQQSVPVKTTAEVALGSSDVLAELPIANEDWPGYRGVQRDGIVHGGNIRVDWEPNPPKQLWKHPIGLGWSSFAVVAGLAYTQEQRQQDEVISCYRVETGEQVWVHKQATRFTETMGGDGPRGTPTLDETGRLYAVGATGQLVCLNARTGKQLWERDMLQAGKIPNIEWGQTASPWVDVERNLVIVVPGGQAGYGVVAYDRLTGEQRWHAGDHPASYASPQVNRLHDQDQLLVFEGLGIAGHDLETGALLWSFPWSNGPKVNAAQPVVLPGQRVFFSNGYGVGSAMLEIKKEGKNFSVKELWQSKQMKMKFNSGVVNDDQWLYGLDEGILTCFDLTTGKRLWKGGRFGYGQVLMTGSHLIVSSENGEIVLVKATPQAFEERGRFQAIEGKTWNPPALWKGFLLVRNGEEAACFDLRKTEEVN